jgi:hypothetical protein
MRHIKEFNQLFESQQELTQEQIDWLDMAVSGTWSVNPQTGLVDIAGDFWMSKRNLVDFKGVRFGKVSGFFNCSDNSLTSLAGAPQSVGKFFNCSDNSLTSLKGAPQEVGASFNCSDNSLTSLEGAPQEVGASFNCSDNSLTSLKGAPKRVGSFFNCSDNSLSSLEGAPQWVGGDLYFNDNTLSERAIKTVLERMFRKGFTLEQAVKDKWRYIPKEDKLYLAKHHPDLSQEKKAEYEALGRFKRRVI